LNLLALAVKAFSIDAVTKQIKAITADRAAPKKRLQHTTIAAQGFIAFGMEFSKDAITQTLLAFLSMAAQT
jgi:hypothetical protein